MTIAANAQTETVVFKDGAETPFAQGVHEGTEDTFLVINGFGTAADQNVGARRNSQVGVVVTPEFGNNIDRRGL